MIEILHDVGENIFIDGTKIESCANQYTFVWKKAVTKNLAKLLEKHTLISLKSILKSSINVVNEIVIQKQMKMLHL